jgi:outer membrane protein assembly factor BamD (BamD/ComL family)
VNRRRPGAARPSLVRLGLGSAAVVVGALGLAAPAAAKSAPAARTAPEAAAYLQELEARGLVDKTVVTPAMLASEVRKADDELVAGQAALAAARLYAVVEGPRYQDFSDSSDFQDAEYRLGLALARGGSTTTARRYLGRSLGRGAQSPYYHAALRAYVDVCLDEHIAAACAQEITQLGAEDVNQELAYLQGRALYDAGKFERAEQELQTVSAHSRFYSSALYLRGVMRVKRSDLRGAQDAFCAIADVKKGDTIRFYIDGRYYALRDLARLALGRIAHEEGRDDDAFYHYFLIPSDSKKLPDALFEAAWSSLSRKEYDLGARLADEFMKQYGTSPRASEARLLRATLQVKTCRFADAEKGFDSVLAEYEPLTRYVDRALVDPATRRTLAERLLGADEMHPVATNDIDGLIASMLEVDARFFRLHAIARGLTHEASDVDHVEADWQKLERRVAESGAGKTTAARRGDNYVQPVTGGPVDAAALLEKVNALGDEIARARAAARKSDEAKTALAALESRRIQLAGTLERVLEVGSGGGERSGLVALVHADVAAANGLRARAASLAWHVDAASSELIRQSLVELRGRLEGMLRQARLGKIDAVIGQKRKLEKQIEDLAAGRFPAEMFGKLHIEGLIGDDEEYWPPENERWADEYENYK